MTAGGGDTLAEWAGYASGLQFAALPPEVQERAAWLVLDTVGAIVAGIPEAAARQARACLPAAATSSLEGAILLGVLAQAADLDETNLGAGCHIACTIVPAAMAAAAVRPCTGTVFLAAVVAGYELEAAVGRALAPRHGSRGWHPTGTLGAFGAAVTAARVLGLGPEPLARALAIAGTQAAGTKSVFGSGAKALNAGNAACNGLLSARLAAAGMTGGGSPFADPRGFLSAAGSGQAVVPIPEAPAILNNHFKFLPCCIETHAAARATVDVCSEEAGRPPVALEVALAPSARAMVDRPAPVNLEEARFSVQYAIARVLRGGLASPAPEPYDPGALRSLCPVEIAERPMNHLAAEVTAHWGTCSRSAAVDLGPRSPLERERLRSKFDALTRSAFGERGPAVREAVLGLARAADAGEALAPVLDAARRAM